MARFDLTDVEWVLIQPLLPNKPRGVARGMTGACCTVSSGCSGAARPGGICRDDTARSPPSTTVGPRRASGFGSLRNWPRNPRLPFSSSTARSSAPTSTRPAVKRGRGSRYRSFSWRIEHQDQRYGGRTRPAGGDQPVAGAGLGQGGSSWPVGPTSGAGRRGRRPRIRCACDP